MVLSMDCNTPQCYSFVLSLLSPIPDDVLTAQDEATPPFVVTCWLALDAPAAKQSQCSEESSHRQRLEVLQHRQHFAANTRMYMKLEDEEAFDSVVDDDEVLDVMLMTKGRRRASSCDRGRGGRKRSREERSGRS